MPDRDRMTGSLIAIGRVRRAVGLDGRVEVELYSGDHSRLSNGMILEAGDRQLVVERISPGRKGSISVYFEGIKTRDASDRLRGLELEMQESTLPEPPGGGYYHFQLIGAEVKDPAGGRIGTLSGIMETGANDVYVVSMENGDEILVPATRDVVKNVDIVSSVIIVDLPSGEPDQTEDQ